MRWRDLAYFEKIFLIVYSSLERQSNSVFEFVNPDLTHTSKSQQLSLPLVKKRMRLRR